MRNRHALQNCNKIWLVGGWTGVFFPRNFLPRQCFPDCPSWPMRQRMVMDSGGGLRVGSLLRLACASNSKPDVAIRCGMHGCWAQEVGKALIAKASSFNAKQAWVRNHMADLLPSLTESILYIYIQPFLDVCGWWQFEHIIREVNFFPTHPLCFCETLVLGMSWWPDFVWFDSFDGTLMEPFPESCGHYLLYIFSFWMWDHHPAHEAPGRYSQKIPTVRVATWSS